uniref:Uncharacterized protein n=1 Tax=Chenopodium quinoa TaxID=63459 RepID=A0A803NAJ9_CHEQI
MLSRSRGFGGNEDETQDAGAIETVHILSRSRGFGGGQKRGRSGSQPVSAQSTPLIVSLDEEETQDAGATEIVVSETQFEQGESSPNSRELDPDGFCALNYKAVKSNGVLPNAGDLYLKTHFKEVPGKGSVPCSSKAKRITEAYLKAVAECKEKGVQKDPNQMFLDVVGGKKRGTVPGLGISVDMYYSNGKRSRLVRSSSNTYCPSVAQLSSQIQREQEENERRCQELSTQHQQQLEAYKAQMERQLEERLQKEREENERRQREYLEEMRKMMMKVMSQLCGVSDSAV